MSPADRLILAAEQLELTSDLVCGMTADDVAAVAAYLLPLAEHGYRVCELSLKAIDDTHPDHPTRDAGRGTDLQAALGHASDLFSVLIHFAYDAGEAADGLATGATDKEDR